MTLPQKPHPLFPAGQLFPFILVTALFFLWGMANNLNDILIAQFKKAFTLSDFRAGLVQSAFYLGYFLLAIPAGMFTRRFGYKGAVVVGLLLYACGAFLFWPAAELRTYGMFLVALFVLASGLAFLETSANPFATVLGPPETAAQRLNLAQAFNPLGSITGVVIGQQFIFSGMEHTPGEIAAMSAAERSAYLASESTAVQLPYLIIGLVVLGLWEFVVWKADVPYYILPGPWRIFRTLITDWGTLSGSLLITLQITGLALLAAAGRSHTRISSRLGICRIGLGV